MTAGTSAIDGQVLKVSRETIARCLSIESESGLACLVKKAETSSSGDESKIARNFFYLSLTRALSEGLDVQPSANLRAIEAGTYFLYQHVMHIDAVVDRGAYALIAPGNAYLVLGLEQLRAGVGHEARFSGLRAMAFDRLQATLGTVELERFEGDVPRHGYDGYAAIARQKCAMADLVPHALLAIDAGEDDARCSAQVRALEHVHVGMQWIDDLADLAKDRASRQPSLLWSRLADWAAQNEIDLAGTDDRRFRQFAYTSRLASQSLQEAIAEFNAAQACVSGLGLAMFQRTLESMIEAQERNCALIETLLADAQRKAAA